MSNLGYKTVYSDTVNILNTHQENTPKYLQKNHNNIMIVNMDDYHGCHNIQKPTMSNNFKNQSYGDYIN